MRILVSTSLLLVMVLSSCSPLGSARNRAALLDPGSPAMTAQAPDSYRVEFETTQGRIVVEVQREWAPRGADRFYNLARHGFYDGARFFRVIPGFVVQFGVSGEPEITSVWRRSEIRDDPVQESNLRGHVTFATAGANTRTTQVFINLADNERLDSMGFAPFGRVVEGMEVVDALYDGYGESMPRGQGPIQDRIEREGNLYLEEDFPELDYIVRTRVRRN
jgi:peptidyl-prolyl cis-trans isomerase A (cyclophilin A)